MKFWIHIDQKANILDGRGYSVGLGAIDQTTFLPSAKATIWADKDSVLSFCHKRLKGCPLRDLGSRIEVDSRGETLAFVEMDAH